MPRRGRLARNEESASLATARRARERRDTKKSPSIFVRLNAYAVSYTHLDVYKRQELHYTPDPVGDLLINGIASDILRTSYTNGLQGDGSYKINSAHTIRAGFTVSGEQTFVGNSSLVEPAPAGVAIDAPETITDNVSKLGWLAGIYAQDEWKITDKLTINSLSLIHI